MVGINNYTNSFYKNNSNISFGSSPFDTFNQTKQYAVEDHSQISQQSKPVKPEKKEMSTTAKCGIGIGLAALAAAGIYIVTKGKAGNTKQLSEFIEFKPANTMEEAKSFAKENFGISKYELKNLEVANYLNEGLSNLSNKFKGKVPMLSL